MKVYVLICGDYEGTFFADAVFSTRERADEVARLLNTRNYPTVEMEPYGVEEVELDKVPEGWTK